MPPNPPATKAQQPVNSGKACCPYAAQKPCDVSVLSVKVDFKMPNGTATSRQVTTTKVKRRLGPYKGLSNAINRKLGSYDFIIDVFADPPSGKDAAVIGAAAEFSGLHCDKQLHGLMQLKALSGAAAATTSKKVNQKLNTVGGKYAGIGVPFLDNGFAEDKGGLGADVTFIFDLIASLMLAMNPREVEVVAWGCGKHIKGDTSAVNKDLRGLVRIVRPDVWTIGIKIPALGKFTREGAANRQFLTGAKEGTFSSSGRLGSSSSGVERSSTQLANGGSTTSSTRTQMSGGQGSTFEQSRTNFGGEINRVQSSSSYTDRAGSSFKGYTQGGKAFGPSTRELVEERMKKTTGFNLEISRNGYKLDIKSLLTKLKKAVELFSKTLAEVQELFLKAPQVGWKFTFEVSALAGSIVLEIRPQLEKAKVAADRYLPINYTLDGTLKLTLIDLKLELSFGLEAMALDTGLVLKIAGSLELKVSIDTSLALNMLTNPRREINLNADGTCSLKIIGYISLVGKTVAEASLTISSGLEFKNAKLIIDVSKPDFDFKGVLRAKPILVTGVIKVPWWWDKKIDPPITLLKGADIHTFK